MMTRWGIHLVILWLLLLSMNLLKKNTYNKLVITFWVDLLALLVGGHLVQSHTLNIPARRSKNPDGANTFRSMRGWHRYGNVPQSNYITPETAIATVPTAGSGRELHRKRGAMLMTPVYADYLGSGIVVVSTPEWIKYWVRTEHDD